MNSLNTLVLLLINGGLVAALVYVGDALITSQRERARLRYQHREMTKTVDALEAKIKSYEVF